MVVRDVLVILTRVIPCCGIVMGSPCVRLRKDGGRYAYRHYCSN